MHFVFSPAIQFQVTSSKIQNKCCDVLSCDFGSLSSLHHIARRALNTLKVNMARSQNSFIKKQKAEKKRKKRQEKIQRKIEKKNKDTSGDLKDMIAYLDEDGNIVDESPEESERQDSK